MMCGVINVVLFLLLAAAIVIAVKVDGKREDAEEALELKEQEFGTLRSKHQKLQQELQQKQNLQKKLQQVQNELQYEQDLVSQAQGVLREKDNKLDSCIRENFKLKQWNEKLECQLKFAEENGALMFGDTTVLQNRQEFLDACVSEAMQRLSEAGADVDEELLSETTASSFDDIYIGDMLSLNKRMRKCLRLYEIRTMGALLSCKASDLLEMRNLGHGTLNELVAELGKHGLKLMDEDDGKTQARIDKILLPSRMKLTAVEELGLPGNVYNAVKSFGCDTVDDI